jgi:hypothetical protein
MQQNTDFSLSHTADYTFIDVALKARWEPFCALAREVESFTPITDFSEYRESEVQRLQRLNPSSRDDELLRLIDGQIRAKSDPAWQFAMRFTDRVMAEYVTVAFLAHALAESVINTVLAVGLSTAGAHDVFSLLERADIKEKWCFGPKAFHAAYELPKGSTLFQSLQHLTRERNAFVHYKIELEMHGEKKLAGSRLHRAPLSTQMSWMKRFFSLPYDLARHARAQMPGRVVLLLHDSRPIELFSGHAHELAREGLMAPHKESTDADAHLRSLPPAAPFDRRSSVR